MKTYEVTTYTTITPAVSTVIAGSPTAAARKALGRVGDKKIFRHSGFDRGCRDGYALQLQSGGALIQARVREHSTP